VHYVVLKEVVATGFVVIIPTAEGLVAAPEFALAVELVIRRQSILADVMTQLRVIYAADREALFLPLRVRFEGEEAVDAGGVGRELMSLAIAELLRTNSFLSPCGQSNSALGSGTGSCLWFNSNSDTPLSSTKAEIHNSSSRYAVEDTSDEFFLGLLVGLAAYNNIYIDVPLPAAIYKVMTGTEVSVVPSLLVLLL
jgi:hypothetical protein